MELTRKQVIEILDLIKKQYHPFNINQQRLICALEYAINSLKTDEAYQLMYEGEEVYTKDEVVSMLEELKKEIEELQGKYSPYYDEASQHTSEIIQQKINALKVEGEDSNV